MGPFLEQGVSRVDAYTDYVGVRLAVLQETPRNMGFGDSIKALETLLDLPQYLLNNMIIATRVYDRF